MSSPRPPRRPSSSPGKDSINNMMVKNLLSGRGDFVRQLQMVGFRFDNLLDEVSTGNFFSSEGHEVARHSVWKWSHHASVPQGVSIWWEQLNKVLLTTQENERAPLLSNLFIQAAEAVIREASRSFDCFAKTWDKSTEWFGLAPGWDVKTRDNLLFNMFPKCGDDSALFINEMWKTNRWSNSHFQHDHFLKAWQNLSELAVNRFFPALLSELLNKAPATLPSRLMVSNKPALEWVWQSWIDEHNRPSALSMNDEGFQRQTEVLILLLNKNTHWPKSLQDSFHHHLPSIQKNKEWASLSALLEKQVLGQSLVEAKTSKNKTNRL